MRRLRALWLRLLAPATRARQEQDFAAELESHLQLHIDDNIRRGMTADAARRDAILKLGGVTQVQERQREQRGLPILDVLRQDLAFGLRLLRRQPAFTLTAVLTLGLGVGATSAIFSVVNAVLLRPLPFVDSDRLVMIYAFGSKDDPRDSVSYPTFVDWRDQSHSFESAAAIANRSITITAAGEAELVLGKQVTTSFFHVLGVQPALGRAFRAEEEEPAASHVVILSDAFWKRRFGGSERALGATIRINDLPFTVVGVMPPGFHVDQEEREQLYAPLPIDSNRRHGFLRVIARLRPGVTRAQARADLDAITARLSQIYGASNEAKGSTVMALVDAQAGPGRLALFVLLAMVFLVLLIGCTNVASLLLARGAARQHEMAVRAALGAGRGRLAGQLLTESALLALGGGAVGLLFSDVLARLLVAIITQAVSVPRIDATRVDGVVLLFTLVVSIATGVVFGVIPALSSASPDLHDALHDTARTSSGRRGPRLRRALVVIETALALVLLAAAGVMMRTLITMRSTHPGFDSRNMLTAAVYLPPSQFPGLASRAPFFEGVLSRVRALPDVASAALVADLPLNGETDTEGFHLPSSPDPARWYTSGFNITSARYFETMGIPIRAGRGFLDSDTAAAPGVIVVNESAARRFWPDRSPLGQQIVLPIDRQKSVALTIVGVVANVRHRGLGQPPRSEIYVNSAQSDLTWPRHVLVIRARANPIQLAGAVRAAVRETNPNVPIPGISTMDDVIARSMAPPRLYSLLFAAFACAAVGLAAVGLYGLVSFTVTQRAHEIGIRVALGASRREILRLVLTQGIVLAAVGAGLGVAGGLAATRALVALMQEIEPNDPTTFVAVTAVLLGAAALASYLPARRASRMDPLRALRAE